MGREIKFRAWLFVGEDGLPTDDEEHGHHEMTYDLAFEDFEPINDLLAGVDNLMQFTGLRDENGAELYEGDLLEVDGCRLVEIVWHESTAQFDTRCRKIYTRRAGAFRSLLNNQWRYRCKKIGNIHENPELLK